MKIIVDANIFLAVILNEPEKEQIIKLTKGVELISPEIIHYEIGNSLSAMLKKNRLREEQIKESFNIFSLIPIQLVKTDIAQALVLACKLNIYAYDAYYLEVAQRLKIPLLTLDKPMIYNANKLNIKILEIKNENI